MKPDDLWLASDGNFDQVIPAGPVRRALSYLGGVVALMLGPALVIVIAAAGELAWQTLLGGAATLVFIGGFGVASMVSTARMQRRVERLARHGRPATAEVVSSRTASIGEETGTEVTMLVTGDGFEPFRATHRSTDARIERLGQRFRLVVDPSDGAYLIVD